MYRNIVVGLNESGEARDALALAEVLRADDGVVTTAFAYPDSGLLHGGEWRTLLEKDADELLEQVSREAGEPGWLHAVRLPARSPARGLQQVVEEREADLVVVGSSHRGRAGLVLAGTVALRLLNGSPCPVALAPKRYRSRRHRLATIGIGFDGSPEAANALHEAERLARHAGAMLEPICAIPDAEVWMGELGLYVERNPELLEQYRREELQRLLARATEALPDDLHARIETVEGPPGHALAQASSDLDLLVMGSRGYGPLRRVLLGSASAGVVREAMSPVLIVPRGVRAGTHRDEPVAGHAVE